MQTIKVKLNDIKSIKQGEVQKAKIEKQGFSLVHTIMGFNEIELIYIKDNQ